jgi:leader peptidase (prepilin peptidase) / N-methyltransferase
MLESAATLAPGAARWTLLAVAPFIGSFLGVVIRRLPEERPVIWSRSHCEGCGHLLGWRDLVPFFGWLFAKGRCRYCGRALGSFYPAVEIAALAVATFALVVDGGARAWLDSLFGWWLLALGWIDLRRWILPDVLTLPLVLAGLLEAALLAPAALLWRAIGAVLGYLSLAAVAFLYRRLRGRDGLGEGDAKLLAASGAWIGAAALPSVVLAASVGGLVGALLLAAKRRLGAQTALPFGPFLALATWLVWLFGPFAF